MNGKIFATVGSGLNMLITYVISLRSSDKLLRDGAALWQVNDNVLPFVRSQFMAKDGLFLVSIYDVIRAIFLLHLGDGDHLPVLLPLLAGGVDVNGDDPPGAAENRIHNTLFIPSPQITLSTPMKLHCQLNAITIKNETNMQPKTNLHNV